MGFYSLSGCGAVGSAGGLGPSGRRFEPCHSDHKKTAVFARKRRFLQLLKAKYKTYLTLDHLSYFDAFWGFIEQLPQKYGEFYRSINETLIILDISFDHN